MGDSFCSSRPQQQMSDFFDSEDDSGDFYSGEDFEFDASDDEEEIFFDDGFERPPLQRRSSFCSFDESDILDIAKKEISEIMEVLGIPSQALAVILLRHFRWNKENLITSYTEDQLKTCKACGIRTDMKLEKPPKSPKKKFECSVCMDEHRCSKSFALGCGHRFCAGCWKQYLQVHIKDGIECLSVTCMAKKCDNVVHEEVVKRFVSSSYYDKYTRYMLRSYVEDNDKVKWCPAPDCNHCVKSERSFRKEPVTCSCGFSF